MGEKDNIRKVFENKNFDDESLEYISNFIEEFDSIFGKYVPREEVIRRINENLDEIITYDFENNGKREVLGNYNIEKKRICITNKDIGDGKKSVFFHEMVHCIMSDAKERKLDFITKSLNEDYEYIELKSRGLTEGFTEYVTKKRDEKYDSKGIKAYPILVEQFENLVDLIGEDEIFDIGFNRPSEFCKAIGYDAYEIEDLFEAFNTIWIEEDKIVSDRQLAWIFDKKEDTFQLAYAKSTIIRYLEEIVLSRTIKTVEELNKVFETIERYSAQLDNWQLTHFENILEKIEELQEAGLSMEEIINGMEELPRSLFELKNIMDKFEESSNEEKIDTLTQEEFIKAIEDNPIYETKLKNEILARIGGNIINTYSIDENKEICDMLVNGMAQIINEKGYNIDRLAIEFVDFESNESNVEKMLKMFFNFDSDSEKRVFNLYDTDIGKNTYLGTFLFCYDDITEQKEIIEYSTDISEEYKKKILDQYPQLRNKVLLVARENQLLGYAGNDEYLMIDEEDSENEKTRVKSSKKDGTTYYKSKLEGLQETLKRRKSGMDKMITLGAPQGIINEEMKRISGILSQMSTMTTIPKISLGQIKEVTSEIKDDKIEQVMQEMLTTEEKRKEAIERGMGYEKE